MKKSLGLAMAITLLLAIGPTIFAQSATMYTLDDIYYYLTEGEEASEGGHSLEPPAGAVPGDTRFKTLAQIYNDVEALFDLCDATPDMVETGYYFFCADTNYWGVREGTYGPPAPSPPTEGGEWVLVPGNAEIGTDDFYVMKYEAKNVSGGAYSQADTTPWVNINLVDAAAACEVLGGGYHLLTVDEAQTINRNLEQVASNWSGGSVGSGGLYRGNCGLDDALGYNGSDPEYGTGRNTKARLTLSNGQEIWDWSGNVWEWIWGEGSNGTIGTSGGVTWRSTAGYSDWNIADLNDEREVLGPSDNSWTSTQGMGQYYGGTSTKAFIRGGPWDHVEYAGVFDLNLNVAPTVTSTPLGFRCCK